MLLFFGEGTKFRPSVTGSRCRQMGEKAADGVTRVGFVDGKKENRSSE